MSEVTACRSIWLVRVSEPVETPLTDSPLRGRPETSPLPSPAALATIAIRSPCASLVCMSISSWALCSLAPPALPTAILPPLLPKIHLTSRGHDNPSAHFDRQETPRSPTRRTVFPAKISRLRSAAHVGVYLFRRRQLEVACLTVGDFAFHRFSSSGFAGRPAPFGRDVSSLIRGSPAVERQRDRPDCLPGVTSG